MISRWWRRADKGTTAVEFAIVGWMLCMVTFGIVETGLLWWVKSGLKTTASMTARCGAIGYRYNTANFSCTSAATTQAYAVNAALAFLFPNMVTTAGVTLNGSNGVVASCNGFVGNFFSVSINSTIFSGLPLPLQNYASVSASSCFPMP